MAGGRACLIGFDGDEAAALAARMPGPCVGHSVPPRLVADGDLLFAETPNRTGYEPVSRVVFHGIFEDDPELLAALALWGGPCFPAPRPMMDCRLRLPGLVRALPHTRFGLRRGFASPGATYRPAAESVAKWGNWHCGENKARVTAEWAAEPTLFEPFVEGDAVRVVILGGRVWQIRMAGPGWLKSVHATGATFMDADPELVEDTKAAGAGLGLDILANDYIVAGNRKALLEVNHIPSVTCFPELWQAYLDAVAHWAAG